MSKNSTQVLTGMKKEEHRLKELYKKLSLYVAKTKRLPDYKEFCLQITLHNLDTDATFYDEVTPSH